jgi:tetratricopeptide (TPR) repeat protein
VASALVPVTHKWQVRWICYAVVCTFAAMTIFRNFKWASAEQLYLATLEREPQVVAFHNNLAEIYIQRNDDDRAKSHLEAALRAWQDKRFVQRPFEAYGTDVGLAVLALRQHDYTAAQSHLANALEVNPDGDWAYMYLGVIYMERDHNYAAAIRDLERAVQLGPLNDFARVNLGAALFNQGKLLDARRMFAEALQINPTNTDAQNRLKLLGAALGRKE